MKLLIDLRFKIFTMPALLMSLLFFGHLGQTAPGQTANSPNLRSERTSDLPRQESLIQAEHGYLIYFKSRLDLSSAESILVREERGRWVVEKLQEQAEISQARARDLLDQMGLKFQSFFVENVIHVQELSSSQLSQIKVLPEVDRIIINARIPMAPVENFDRLEQSGMEPNSNPVDRVEPHLRLIHADRVWQELGVRGQGIVIGSADTGVMVEHQSIRRQYRGSQPDGSFDHNYNWHDGIRKNGDGFCAGDTFAPCDDKDHGTHTVGTMVGDDGGTNKIGVAPEAQWIACRNMQKGVGTVASYLECFEFFLSPYPLGSTPQNGGRPDLARHIVNNSWSCPREEGCRGDEFQQTVQAYRAAGILLVAAAGNYGPSCSTISYTPARHSGEILVVGAYNTFLNEVAFFSARGPSSLEMRPAPDVVAPGAFVRSAVTTGINAYDDKPGTSMASPQAAGVVALLWSAYPELEGRIDETLKIIQESATATSAKSSCPGLPANQRPNAEYGYGMLNAWEALQRAKSRQKLHLPETSVEMESFSGQ